MWAETTAPVTGLAREARRYRQEGIQAQRAGNMQEAVTNYQKAAALDPSYTAVYEDLARLAGQPEPQTLEAPTGSAPPLQESSGHFPIPSPFAWPQGTSAFDVGRLTKELAQAYYNLGVAYTELKAYSKAVEAYERSLALNPANAQAHAHLGLLYKHVRNDPEKASRHLRTYLRLNPHAADREQLEALLALMQRDQAKSSTAPESSVWGLP